MHTILFPLRTSVELFEDRHSPEALTRAKEGALLYDRLVFEVGLADLTITDSGTWDTWLPPDHLTPERLQLSRKPVRVGAPMQIVAQSEAYRGGPTVGEPHLLMQGSVGAQFVSEFHTGILDELAEFEPNWVHTVSTGGSNLGGSTPLGRAQRRLDSDDRRDKSLMSEVEHFQREFIYKAFNRDMLVAGALGAAFSITGLFAPMVRAKGISPDHAGSEPLDILVPNVGALPWEAVVQWRDHPGSQEARAVLREFEQRAAAAEPEDAQAFLKQVMREVVTGYEAVYQELRPTLPEQLQEEIAKTFVSFIPGVGPLVEKGATITAMVAEELHHRRSWVAAMMALRERAGRAAD